MMTRTLLPCPQFQNRNKGPWSGLSENSAVTLADEAAAPLPLDPAHAGVDLECRFPIQPIKNAHKLTAFRYQTDDRKPTDIHRNSTGIPLAVRYPLEFMMTTDHRLMPFR
jgi:hypothetical protein